MPIVEGDGEVEAVPVLLRRLLTSMRRHDLLSEIAEPHKTKRTKIWKKGELEKAVEYAASEENCRVILLIYDADDDCAKDFGASLVDRARKARSDKIIEVAVAVREYEGWLIAGVRKLRGRYGFPRALEPVADPESIRGAKEWLDRKMDRAYKETIHQASFSASFDICAAYRRSHSFRHFCKIIKRISRQLPPDP